MSHYKARLKGLWELSEWIILWITAGWGLSVNNRDYYEDICLEEWWGIARKDYFGKLSLL
jgi:hypothetical protein